MNIPLSVTIVIPIYNEEENLHSLLEALEVETNKIDIPVHLIFVDDHSEDRSYQIIANACENKLNWAAYQLPKRSGQTGCYEFAFDKVTTTHIIRMDADLQDDPADLSAFIGKIKNGSDLVMGLRECRKHKKLLRIASMLYDLLILALFETPLHSNSGSYVAFRTKLVQDLPWKKNDHRYLPLIAIHRGAENISEVIVSHSDRKGGVSKYNPATKVIKGVPEVLLFLLRLRFGHYNYKSG